MELVTENEVIYVGVDTRKSQKTGSEFHLLKIADPREYQSFEFFLNDSIDVQNLKNGDPCLATFNISKNGYKNQLDLKKLEKIDG